jgi:hypothetical protein
MLQQPTNSAWMRKALASYQGPNEHKAMDMTTLLIIVIVVLLLGGGGFYGRGRWW